MFRILLVFVTITPGLFLAEARQCCPQGYTIRQKNETYYCRIPKTNTTSPVALNCSHNTGELTADMFDFDVNSAGQLIISIPNHQVEYNPGDFCVGNASIKTLTKMPNVALVCFGEDEPTIDEEAFGYCMVVSCIFLLITAAIYIALPELRDLQGKSIINFCLSLGIGLGILAIMRLVSYSDMNLCATRGFLGYFFVIASFFWMNAISIQILVSLRRPTISNYGWKEFIYYAIYAWICPVILTLSMAIVNFIPGDHFKPGIGLNHCWFFDRKQQWYYMYSVMSILIAVNILIFLYISIQLWKQTFSSSHIRALRYKFAMTFRMSVIMGVGWIFEMIGSLSKSHVIWEILDLFNSLQGVLIFLVLVVFRRKVIKSMYKHGWLDGISTHVEKYLAVGEDEEDVVQHTIGLTLDETNKNNKH